MGTARWVASRYNVQATTGDGRLLIWNTLQGSITAFPAGQRDRVRATLTRRGFEAPATGLVSYLAKRGCLVKEGSDEFRRFRHRFGRTHYTNDHLELMLLASEDCNFRCEYCYESFPRGTMQPWVRASVKKLVERRLDGLRSLTLSWFGGEPLYGFEAIAELGPFFQQKAAERGIRFSAGVTTNGYLLAPDVADKLLRWGTKNFQVTLDGPAEDHDRRRPTRTGEGSFARIFENLTSLRGRSEDFNSIIRINFDSESHPRLHPFIEALGDAFGNDSRFRLLLRPVARWGGANDPNLEVCGVEEEERVIEELTHLARARGIGNFDDLRISGRFGAMVCYAARPNHLVIGADGKVMKCTVALGAHDANIVGRLMPDGELEIDEDKLTIWTEPTFDSVGKCRKCVVLPTCQSLACPYGRLRSGEAPCPPVRSKSKKRLVQIYGAPQRTANTVRIEQGRQY